MVYKAVMQRYQQANNGEKMVEMAKKVLSIDPDDPEALVSVAQVEVEKVKDDSLDKDVLLAEAKKNEERALVTVETDVPVSGYPEEQLKMYPAGQEIPPALYWRARLAEEEGDYDRAGDSAPRV